VGEKVNDLESFDPKQYISRLLGLGDLKALVEKIQLSIQEAERKKLEESLKKKKFNLVDFYTQISAMQQVGPLRKIVELIPGMSKLQLPEGLLDIQEQKLKRWKYAIDSMTKAERENPEIINSSRLSRISKGSHVPVSEIKELLKQYKLMNEFFSEKLKAGFDERQLQKLYKRFRFLR
jgi:signal recognition particle subunit SRP54